MDVLENLEVENDQEEEEETVTAQSVLSAIREAWQNEKLSPELLPHKSEYVEVMMEQVEQMEDNLQTLDTTDLRYLVHRQELERIRYLLRSYLRTRLSKIEAFSLDLLGRMELLSPAEARFLTERATADLQVFKSLADRMDPPANRIDPEEMRVGADLGSFVFIRAKEESVAVLAEENEEVNMPPGSQHILPYSAVQELIYTSKAVLI